MADTGIIWKLLHLPFWCLGWDVWLNCDCGLECLHEASPRGLGFLTTWQPQGSQTSYTAAQGLKNVTQLKQTLPWPFTTQSQKSHSITFGVCYGWKQSHGQRTHLWMAEVLKDLWPYIAISTGRLPQPQCTLGIRYLLLCNKCHKQSTQCTSIIPYFPPVRDLGVAQLASVLQGLPGAAIKEWPGLQSSQGLAGEGSTGNFTCVGRIQFVPRHGGLPSMAACFIQAYKLRSKRESAQLKSYFSNLTKK